MDPLVNNWKLIFEIGTPIVEAVSQVIKKYNQQQLKEHVENHKTYQKIPDCIFCSYDTTVIEPRTIRQLKNLYPQVSTNFHGNCTIHSACPGVYDETDSSATAANPEYENDSNL